MRLLRRLVPALFLVLLALATVRATSCGEGGDGSVANCCYDVDGVCYGCAEGYGKSDDGRKCIKCNVKNCIYCDGNPDVCDQVKEPPVKNCLSVSDTGGDCDDCEEGYTLVTQPKDALHKYFGVQRCLKCKAKNCDQCKSGNMSKCNACKTGYGAKKGICQPCRVKSCGGCSDDVDSCMWCKDGYGLVTKGKGKSKKTQCLPCPKGCFFCNDDNTVCLDDKYGK